jgi:hypothetical protein
MNGVSSRYACQDNDAAFAVVMVSCMSVECEARVSHTAPSLKDSIVTAEPRMQRAVQQARTFGQLDSWGLRSPGTLGRVNGYLLTDFSGQLAWPILTGQAVFWGSRTLEDWTHRSSRDVAKKLPSRKSEGLNHPAAEARNLAICFPDWSQCDRLAPAKLGTRGDPLRLQDHDLFSDHILKFCKRSWRKQRKA